MTLWGGRFSDPPADSLWRFTVDTADRRLLPDDVTGSRAHVAMLAEVGLLSHEDAALLDSGLGTIANEADAGTFEFEAGDEDVHTAVERRLRELIGPVAGKLHTGRSRNDQVVLDLRLYLHRAGTRRSEDIAEFIGVLVAKAEEVEDIIVPSYTHLQQAQAVPLAHQLLAYGWMLLRDRARLREALVRLHVSPMGAGASGGSSLPLEPGAVAGRLGMGGVFDNSLDAVASRDFVSEYVFCCGQTMAHLSRLAEDLVLWASAEFGWVRYSDAYTTGSSALPQKRNPDIAELVRGRAAAVIGDVTSSLVLQKGLALSYNRDLQEDKRMVFHADDVLAGSLEALGGMVSSARFDPPAPGGDVGALDLAEALVERGVPFREAHRSVGAVVAALAVRGMGLRDATAEDLLAVDDRFSQEDLGRLDPAASIAARQTPGGGSLESVRNQIGALRVLIDG